MRASVTKAGANVDESVTKVGECVSESTPPQCFSPTTKERGKVWASSRVCVCGDASPSGVHLHRARGGMWMALAWHPGGNGGYVGPCPLEALALACECAVSERGRVPVRA